MFHHPTWRKIWRKLPFLVVSGAFPRCGQAHTLRKKLLNHFDKHMEKHSCYFLLVFLKKHWEKMVCFHLFLGSAIPRWFPHCSDAYRSWAWAEITVRFSDLPHVTGKRVNTLFPFLATGQRVYLWQIFRSMDLFDTPPTACLYILVFHSFCKSHQLFTSTHVATHFLEQT